VKCCPQCGWREAQLLARPRAPLPAGFIHCKYCGEPGPRVYFSRARRCRACERKWQAARQRRKKQTWRLARREASRRATKLHERPSPP